MKLKKIVCLGLSMSMLISSINVVFANETTQINYLITENESLDTISNSETQTSTMENNSPDNLSSNGAFSTPPNL